MSLLSLLLGAVRRFKIGPASTPMARHRLPPDIARRPRWGHRSRWTPSSQCHVSRSGSAWPTPPPPSTIWISWSENRILTPAVRTVCRRNCLPPECANNAVLRSKQDPLSSVSLKGTFSISRVNAFQFKFISVFVHKVRKGSRSYPMRSGRRTGARASGGGRLEAP